MIACCLAGMIVATSWYLMRRQAAGFGGIRRFVAVTAKGQPYAAAISPDGTQVAMIRVDHPGAQPADVIEVRDVGQGRDVADFPLPGVNPTQGKTQFYLNRKLSYCDAGKYLLAVTGLDTLEVIDAHSFTVHASFALSGFHLTDSRAFTDLHFLPLVQNDCAAASPMAVFGFWGDLGLKSIKLLDLERGVEVADLSERFAGTYRGDGLAISPDGSKIALATWKYPEGNGVELVDARAGAALKPHFMGDEFRIKHQLAFAGGDALLIGELGCEPEGICSDLKPTAGGRTLRLWSFAGNGAVKRLGVPGAENYRSVGASADGSSVFGYTGDENFCGQCNNGHGEIRVNDARFTVWERATGRAIARSPRLRVEQHECPWVHIGSCSEWEQVPELQMSANGKAFLAFWPQTGLQLTDQESDAGALEIFRLR
jgi:hypothetical protein